VSTATYLRRALSSQVGRVPGRVTHVGPTSRAGVVVRLGVWRRFAVTCTSRRALTEKSVSFRLTGDSVVLFFFFSLPRGGLDSLCFFSSFLELRLCVRVGVAELPGLWWCVGLGGAAVAARVLRRGRFFSLVWFPISLSVARFSVWFLRFRFILCRFIFC
jgi:hypothetical protein